MVIRGPKDEIRKLKSIVEKMGDDIEIILYTEDEKADLLSLFSMILDYIYDPSHSICEKLYKPRASQTKPSSDIIDIIKGGIIKRYFDELNRSKFGI